MQVCMSLKPCDKWDDSSSSIEACIEDMYFHKQQHAETEKG